MLLIPSSLLGPEDMAREAEEVLGAPLQGVLARACSLG